MKDDFSNHPVSIAAIKANKKADAKMWKPRDALIDVLRDIDSGKIDARSVVICLLQADPDGDKVTYVQSSRNRTESLGMLQAVSYLINKV